MQSDVIILGMPIYLGNIVGVMQSFLERLLYPLTSYDLKKPSNFTGKINYGLIYSMNGPAIWSFFKGYRYLYKNVKAEMKRLNGKSETLVVTDTLQYSDYSKYQSAIFDEEKKRKRKKSVFPKDCKKAYEMGRRLASQGAE